MVVSTSQKYLVKIRLVEVQDDSMTIHAELKNGAIVTGTLPYDESIQDGDIYFVKDGQDFLEKAPVDLWGVETYIGVIKHIDDGILIVDVNGMLKSVIL